MSILLPQKGKWIFTFKKEALDENELKNYQKHLFELRKKFQPRLHSLTSCSFYTENDNDLTPPLNDNIYATFKYDCRRHTPKCDGSWYILWNPNLALNHEKLKSSLDNHCATWEFKAVCKSIQKWLIHACGDDYFELLDDDDTNPYYAEMMNSLNFRFSHKEEEFPDSLSGSLENISDIPT